MAAVKICRRCKPKQILGTATVKKLKGGKKYYVRVRTYKVVSGKKYYSAWTKAKTTTVKK